MRVSNIRRGRASTSLRLSGSERRNYHSTLPLNCRLADRPFQGTGAFLLVTKPHLSSGANREELACFDTKLGRSGDGNDQPLNRKSSCNCALSATRQTLSRVEKAVASSSAESAPSKALAALRRRICVYGPARLLSSSFASFQGVKISIRVGLHNWDLILPHRLVPV